MSSRISIKVEGGRPDGHPNASRGVDVGVFAVTKDGGKHLLPAQSLVLRVEGRKAVATVDLQVDDIDVTNLVLGSVTEHAGEVVDE